MINWIRLIISIISIIVFSIGIIIPIVGTIIPYWRKLGKPSNALLLRLFFRLSLLMFGINNLLWSGKSLEWWNLNRTILISYELFVIGFIVLISMIVWFVHPDKFKGI